MCINFVRCGPSCGAEFNAVAERRLDAERERWGPIEQGGCSTGVIETKTPGYRQSLRLSLLPEVTRANHADSS